MSRPFTLPAYRLSLAPLMRATYADNHSQLARKLGMSRERIVTWSRHGMSSFQADHACARLNLHPAVVWGRAWDDLCDWEDPDVKVEWHKRDVERANQCIERTWTLDFWDV